MRILANENVHSDIVKGLRAANHEVLFVPEIGLAGHKDRDILEYAEKHNLILVSGDKDFGGLVQFGTLWGRGKVSLLRYQLINIDRIIRDLVYVLNKEKETLLAKGPVVIVLFEAGYRLHKPMEAKE